MRVYLISDLHTEFGNDPPPPPHDIDVVILAGDMAKGLKCLDVAQFYRKQTGVPVIVLAGNHEYYKHDIKKMLPLLREAAETLDGVHFLECDTLEWNNVRFLGCTLWSNFALYGETTSAFHQNLARQYVNDFRLIRCGHRAFTPADAVQRFRTSYAWLDSELAIPFAGKTVVVTHFAPHPATIHDDYRGTSPDPITPCFTSDCSALMRTYPMVAWLYGHTHNSVDVVVESNVRLVSNQYGYPRERASYTQFDPSKIVVI